MARVQNEMVWTQRSSNYDDYRGRIAELRPLNCFICRCACFLFCFCSEVSGIACNCQLSTQVTGRGLPLLQGLCTYFSWLSCNRKWNVLFQLGVAVANHQFFSQDYHSGFKKLSGGQKLCGPSFSSSRVPRSNAVSTNAVPINVVYTMTVWFPPMLLSLTPFPPMPFPKKPFPLTSFIQTPFRLMQFTLTPLALTPFTLRSFPLCSN